MAPGRRVPPSGQSVGRLEQGLGGGGREGGGGGGRGAGGRGFVRLEHEVGGCLARALDLLVPLQVLVVVVHIAALAALSLDLGDDERHQRRGVEDDDDDDVEELVELAVLEGFLHHQVDEGAVDHHQVTLLRVLDDQAVGGGEVGGLPRWHHVGVASDLGGASWLTRQNEACYNAV